MRWRTTGGPSITRLQGLGGHWVAATVSLGTSGAAAGTALIVNILMARTLGPAARGQVALMLQVAYVLTPLITLGLDRQALKARENRPPHQLLRHVWVLMAAGLLVALAADSSRVAICAAIATAGAVVAIERASGMASGRLRRFVMIQVSIQMWILVASAALALAPARSTAAWGAVYGAPVLGLGALELVGQWRLRSYRRQPKIAPASAWVSKESLTLMIGGFSLLLAARAERLLLPVLASTRDLGIYVSVATGSEILVWAARGLGESRVSTLSAATNRTRRWVLKRLGRDLGVLVAASIPLALALRYVLVPLLGPGFGEAAVLVVPLCASAVMWSLYLQVSSWWLGGASSRFSMALDGVAAVVSVLAGVALIPRLGALGAALGCVFAYGFMVAIGFVFWPAGKEMKDHECTTS